MDKCALLHIPDSQYCFAVDNNKIFVRFRTKKNDVKKVQLIYNVCHRFQKDRFIKDMKITRSDELFDYYDTTIEFDIPSFAYIFKIIDLDDKEYFYSEYELSDTFNFEMSGLMAYRFPFINDTDIVKVNQKFKGDVFYQVFVERFCKGNDFKEQSYINANWDTKDLKRNDPNFKTGVFIGGDLLGIASKLHYIKNLGVDTIYLTPINKSRSNHKYNVEDYYLVDPMFGSNEDLKFLIDEAHKKGLKIVLDLVFNHTAGNHPFFLDILKNGKQSKYYDFYCFKDDKLSDGLNYYTFASNAYMPKINTSSKIAQNYFIEVGKYYIQKYHIDGFRLDVANEVSHDFWNVFKKALLEDDPNILLIGEHWDNANEYLKAKQIDGSMNYGFYTICYNYFINKTMDNKTFVERLNWLLTRYKETTNHMMLNLLDSHDTPRLFDKMNNNKDLYLNALLLMIMYVGYPMIYYGDEIFMLGGADPYNRKGMEWDSENFNSYHHELFKKVVKLRKYDAIKEGDIKIDFEDNLIKITRDYKDKNIVALINNNPFGISKTIEGEMVLKNNYNNGVLQPYSFIVYKI